MQKFCGDIGRFCEGLAVALDGENKWHHVLIDGRPAYAERYKKTEYFQDGLAWAQKQDGIWTRIDEQGREVKMRNTSSVA